MKLGEKGYTLIELLAAITILLIILIPFTNLFFQGFKTDVENTELLNTKTYAVAILDEIKIAVSEASPTVTIGNESFDISNPELTNIQDYPITFNGKEYDLSFSVTNYLIPNDMITGVITEKPSNLYSISVTLLPVSNKVDYQPVSLKTIIKRKY